MPAAKKKSARKTASKKAVPRGGARRMSAAHKAALAEGRAMSATVDRYLSAVNTPKQRGRKVSKATLQQRLRDAEAPRKRRAASTGCSRPRKSVICGRASRPSTPPAAPT